MKPPIGGAESLKVSEEHDIFWLCVFWHFKEKVSRFAVALPDVDLSYSEGNISSGFGAVPDFFNIISKWRGCDCVVVIVPVVEFENPACWIVDGVSFDELIFHLEPEGILIEWVKSSVVVRIDPECLLIDPYGEIAIAL